MLLRHLTLGVGFSKQRWTYTAGTEASSIQELVFSTIAVPLMVPAPPRGWQLCRLQQCHTPTAQQESQMQRILRIGELLDRLEIKLFYS